jgi:hypothetical protein
MVIRSVGHFSALFWGKDGATISPGINAPSEKMNLRVDGFFAEYRKLKAKYVPVQNRPSINMLTHFE